MVLFTKRSISILESWNTPIVVMQGGLGNQLCQWSFAHSIVGSKSFFIDPLYDVFGPRSRGFELEVVLDNCSHVRKNKLGKISTPTMGTFFHLLDRIWEFKNLRLLTESFGYFREDPRIDQNQSLKVPRVIRYAKGYFQKQENVGIVFGSVQKEIIPFVAGILPGVMKKFGLSSSYTVIHVRRGDYESNEFTPIIIGTLSDDYFTLALDKIDSSNLVLLTENREDVEDLVGKLNPDLVLDKYDTTPWETLAIMYGASRFLGSNSSLSWWGARLCSSRGGAVWLPSQWSYWKNIDVNDYHFPTCNIANAYWVQGNQES